jgi:ABC transporter
MDQEVQHLSGGELQRVAITMALGMPADIYLIDEPSAYLDSEQRIIAAKVRARVHDPCERLWPSWRQLPCRICPGGVRRVWVSGRAWCQTDSLRGCCRSSSASSCTARRCVSSSVV